MDYLRGILTVVLVIAIALWLGRLEHHKHPELYVYSWIGSIILLLLVRFFW